MTTNPEDELEKSGKQISDLVSAIFDGTADLVSKLRKMSDKSSTVAERLRSIADMIESISDLQHAAAVAVAEIGAEMIQAERIPSDDESEDEDEYDDDDEEEDEEDD